MVLQQYFITAEQFDAFIQRPDLGDSIYELIAGEIVEKESSPYTSAIGVTVGAYLFEHVCQNEFIGHVTGAGGGYQVVGERYVPSAAYLSKQRQAELSRHGYNPIPPEIAVEVIFDEQRVSKLIKLRRKITNYLAAGTVVWVVFPVSQSIEVHAPGQPVKILRLNDTLEGGDVLPEFSLPVRAIFPSET